MPQSLETPALARVLICFCLAAFCPIVVSPAAGNEPPSGYYNSAEGLAGAALEAALHNIIDNHTVVAYSWPPFLDVDESASNSSHVDLIYSNGTRSKSLNGGSVGDWNREHLWPRSYGIFNDQGADNSDIHNLRPSDVQVNSERGSLIFDDTNPATQVSIQSNAPGCSKDNNSWEPRDDEKGDVARACFYMDVRYDGSDSFTNDLELSDSPSSGNSRFGSRLTLLRWHQLDPPDERERERNHAIYSSWQGNRNPFVDRPEFAGQLFLAAYPALDDDSDGLPDWWEYRSIGDLSANVGDDLDGDGSDTLLEFALASDPADASDRPAVDLAPVGGLTLTYLRSGEAMDAGVSITIERSATLAANSWVPATVLDLDTTPLGGDVDRIDAELGVPGGSTRQFFRVVVSTP